MKVLLVLTSLVCYVLSEAPYPPSGWKPSGALLVLPSRQQNQLSRLESHQQPRQQTLPSAYGPPQPQPDTTNNNQDETGEGSGSNFEVTSQQQVAGPAGSYYVLLPDGRLQKIQYTTAQLKAQAEAPKNNNAFNQQTQNSFGQQQFQFQSNSFNQNAFSGAQRKQQANDKFALSQEHGFGQASNNVNSFQQFNQQTQQTAFKSQQSSGNQQNNKSAVGASQNRPQNDQESEATPPAAVAQFSAAQLKAKGPFPDGFVASVQYSEVPPITAPVYVYNPAPLVRVLRMTP